MRESRWLPTQPMRMMVCLVVLLGLIPLGIYWASLGSVPTVQPAQALERLSQGSGQAVLVDVRSEADFQARHISGAVSLPLAQILNIGSASDLSTALQGKTLFLVGDTGLLSAQAARHLVSLGLPAFNVRGGIQDWGRAWPQFKESPYSRIELAGGGVQEPFRAMSRGEQGAAALALLWIKPIYMLLSAVVAVFLLRRKAPDLRTLGWSLLIFLTGEIFCAINYLLLKDNSYFAEYMHSYSMAVAFGLAAYALLEGLDERLVHFSQADRQCAMLPVCGPCVKYKPVRCGIRRIAQLLGISLLILAIIPLLAPYSFTAYNTNILSFNHYYTRPFIHQWFEARYSPVIAMLLVGLGLLVMQLTPRTTLHPLARGLFCMGVGFFGFGLFRVGLGLVYAQALIWATFWEELTELMFVGGVIYILWVFKHTLLPDFTIRRFW